jgi:signal transduction histidine kinase
LVARVLAMKLTLGQKLFVYTSLLLVLLLCATFLFLERIETRQWEEYLQTQSLSFSRLATPELQKRFRGDFSGGPAAGRPEHFDFLAINRDLVTFAFASATGRSIYRSPRFPDFIDLAFSDDQLFAGAMDVDAPSGARYRTEQLPQGGRLFAVEVPALGPSGDPVLYARFIFSYDSVDQRINEVRAHFVKLLLVSLLASFFLAGVVAKHMVRPIRELNRAVLAVASGDLQTRIRVTGTDEIGELSRAFNEMAASLAVSRAGLTDANDALIDANLELRQMQEGLLRAERLAAIGQLAAGVSHEIDNPVGIILGLAELMLEETAPADFRYEDLRAIIAECKRCRRITGGLLGFARSSVGALGEVDLAQLVMATLDALRPQKLFKHVEIVVHAQALPPLQVDADQIRQVLINLCLNAAQAMSGCGRLTVELSRQDDSVLVEVSDTGPGIPPPALEQVFAPFYSTKGRGEGTGLGLSICRRLIEEHHGELTVANLPGSGALFRIRLPIASPEKNFDNQPSDSIG